MKIIRSLTIINLFLVVGNTHFAWLSLFSIFQYEGERKKVERTMNSHTPNVYEKVETIFLVKKSTFKFDVVELFPRETVQIWCNSPIRTKHRRFLLSVDGIVCSIHVSYICWCTSPIFLVALPFQNLSID